MEEDGDRAAVHPAKLQLRFARSDRLTCIVVLYVSVIRLRITELDTFQILRQNLLLSSNCE